MNLYDKLRIGGVRVGNICFGICVAAMIITLFTSFTPLITALYLLLMLFLIIITLGAIFILVKDFGSVFTDMTEKMGVFTESALKAMPYFAVLAAVTAVVSIILLAFEIRNKKHTSKIIAAAGCAVLSIAFALLSKAVLNG